MQKKWFFWGRYSLAWSICRFKKHRKIRGILWSLYLGKILFSSWKFRKILFPPLWKNTFGLFKTWLCDEHQLLMESQYFQKSSNLMRWCAAVAWCDYVAFLKETFLWDNCVTWNLLHGFSPFTLLKLQKTKKRFFHQFFFFPRIIQKTQIFNKFPLSPFASKKVFFTLLKNLLFLNPLFVF